MTVEMDTSGVLMPYEPSATVTLLAGAPDASRYSSVAEALRDPHLFGERLTVARATKVFGLKTSAILRGAIERGEMRYLRFPGDDETYVTVPLVNAWMLEHVVRRESHAPG
jgi:hypothetical protein